MKSALSRLTDAFWFIPAVLGVAAVVLAQVLISVDRAVGDGGGDIWGTLFYRVGASGSRDILGAIAGSILGVAATSFSITISVLATASSTYGPRLVRNFMNDRGNQFVLGLFGATFLYALIVLRSIRNESLSEGQFVPNIAVNVAVMLAVADVAVLVYFINHIAKSIQVSTLSARVRVELDEVVDHLYPDPPSENATAVARFDDDAADVPSEASGFVVDIDEDELLGVARRHDCVLEVVIRPGDHVVAGEPLVRAHPASVASELGTEVSRAFTLGITRTPVRDIQFAVQQLVEMAVRALSPGTNDPYTAHNAFSELAVGMVPLARRTEPQPGRVDDDGILRLVVTRVRTTELIDDIFTAVRVYALQAPVAMTAAILLARRIGVAAAEPDVRAAILHHLSLIERAERDSDGDPEVAEFCCGEIEMAREAIRDAWSRRTTH